MNPICSKQGEKEVKKRKEEMILLILKICVKTFENNFLSHPSFAISISSAFLRLVYTDGVKGLGAPGLCTCTI